MQFSYNWNAKETSEYSDKSCLVGMVIFSNNVDPTQFAIPSTIPVYANSIRTYFREINGAVIRIGGVHSWTNQKESYNSGGSVGIATVTGYKYAITVYDTVSKKNYSTAGVEVGSNMTTAVQNIQAKILNEFGIDLRTDYLSTNDYFIKNMIVEVY